MRVGGCDTPSPDGLAVIGEMFRPVRRALIALGLLMLGFSGVWIFWQPAHEVFYALNAPAGACTPTACIVLYQLEIGNTGRQPQTEVLVRLRTAILDTAPMKPRVQDFGKFDRPARVTEADGIRTYALGRLDPEDRVTLSFVLQPPDRTALPSWQQIFVAVEPADGVARVGHPGWVILLRIWYAIFSVF